MVYVVKRDGMTVKSCRSFDEAKEFVKKHGGNVFRLKKAKLPKATMLSYHDCKAAKREMYREIYSETNHGFHATRIYRPRED